MATFFNQATLSYNGRLTNSNITEGELVDTLSAAKTAINESYGANDTVVYTVNILNSGRTPITSLSVSDDLGAYTVGNNTVYPLDYEDGSLRLFIDGVLQTAPTVNAGPPLVVTGISIPAGSNASLIYAARTNEFTPLEAGSTLTNTATVTSDTGEPITVSSTITAADNTSLTIAKAISPATVADNGEITYTFIIQNTGNTAVPATADVTVTDTFNPILNPITVTYNGDEWTEGANYTYNEATGEFASLPGQIAIPAATYTQNSETGVVTTTPGVVIITVTGII